MLKLTDIVKTYPVGDTSVTALKGVSIEFRKNEFVAILGHSGCGKTTLLNIIGGLDHYTDGDLNINGISTKEYKDADWDTYRNHSIGFVFQSYNLIPHQSVLSNVELALTLSGVSKADRRARAKEALEMVGLGDQLNKRPSQMSGGQMQRVAIARALVNNPEILLADEPTGALDTDTSTQIMDILKEVAKDRLVIMVTHNPELAEEYANRIIRLVDGEIISDSNPYTAPTCEVDSTPKKEKKTKNKKTKNKSMSFFTALSLSMNNLLTKKARTVLTSFAGSIGIIGIAMILALSNGIQIYIDRIQEETLASYPITINAKSEDMTETIAALMSANEERLEHDLDKVYSSPVLNELINSMTNPKYTENNLAALKKYLESDDQELKELISVIDYTYDVKFDVYFKDNNGKIIKSDAMELMQESTGMSLDMGGIGSLMGGKTMPVYEEMLPGNDGQIISDLIKEQYDVIDGAWPKNANEVVLIVNSNNEVNDFALLALGLTTIDEAKKSWQNIASGDKVDTEIKSWSYDEIRNMTFKLVPACNSYVVDAVSGAYTDISKTESGLTHMYNTGIDIKVSGIIRPNPEASGSMLQGAIGYTRLLTDEIIKITNNSDIVKKQIETTNTDVLTGLPFKPENYTEPTDAEKVEAFNNYVASLDATQKAVLFKAIMSTPSEETITAAIEEMLGGLSRAEIEEMILEAYAAEGVMDVESMRGSLAQYSDEDLFSSVRLMLREKFIMEYSTQIENEFANVPDEQIAGMLDGQMQLTTLPDGTTMGFTDEQKASYHDQHLPPSHSESTYDQVLSLLGVVDKNSPSSINIYAKTFSDKDKIAAKITEYNNKVPEEDQITYTDYVAIMMSSITTIIDVISYVLIAFVAISLIVSSIMIGIITYISVLERIKEIGILRAIGASKRDISRVFNAETLIVGFAAGLFGILVTVLLCIPVNIIIRAMSGITNIGAELPLVAAIVLIIISMVLTLIAGFVPAKIAAKKDPVEALRSE